MKVSELLNEMAFAAGKWPHDFSARDLTGAFMYAKTVSEVGKFTVKQKDLDFALYEGDEFLSFLKIEPTQIKGVQYDSVVLMYTPVENRKMGYSTILLDAIRKLRKSSILFDGPIFNDGWGFLKKVANHQNEKFSAVKVLNKTTGKFSDFADQPPKRNQAFVVEAVQDSE